ncbi:MAG: hypothetical protein HYZ69_00610, partial [Candidatus Colwellbacteria bacterium]|nr:hypothetical protein [Candidatus Colwellbacteria bacterium]
ETVNNSATLQNDDALFLAMAANETWFFFLYFATVGNSTADFKFAFTIPSGATMRWSRDLFKIHTDSTTQFSASVTTSGGTDSFDGNASEIGSYLAGVVVNGSTAGNLQFQWAQNTATAVDTKVLTNSYLEAHK